MFIEKTLMTSYIDVFLALLTMYGLIMIEVTEE